MTQQEDNVTQDAKQPKSLCVRTQTTNAYQKMMISPPHERRTKLVKLAGGRIEVDKVGAPTLLVGLRTPAGGPGFSRPGADAFVNVNGERIRGEAMRDALGIRPAVELIQGAEMHAPGRMWTGLGNIGTNKYCVAWQAGKLYYSIQDIPLLEDHWEFDACVWVKGERWEVSFERVQFVAEDGGWIPLAGGRPIPNAELIVTGQRLVERGVSIDPANDASSRYAISYADKRHNVLNAFTTLINRQTGTMAMDKNGPIRRDFGLDQILANPELLKAAIEGAVVPLNLELLDVDGVRYDVTPEALVTALFDKSYRSCATLDELRERQLDGERGIYHVDRVAGVCYLVYDRSPYPLHFLASRQNGDTVLIDAVIGGFSNNAGCTVAGLARDLRACGFREALLLDNGGDVVLVHRRSHCVGPWSHPSGRCAVVASSLNRTQWAALMLYQAQTDEGIEVRCDAEGQDGRFCIEWD